MLSVNSWTFLNLGNTTIISMPIVNSNTNTAIPVSKLHSQFLFNIFVTAHTAVMGAFINNCNPIDMNIWICVTSLVVLVIKLLVLNDFTSSIDISSTLLNRLFLNSFAKPADIVAAKYPTRIEKIKLPSAHKSIYPPLINISFISEFGVWTNTVMFDM